MIQVEKGKRKLTRGQKRLLSIPMLLCLLVIFGFLYQRYWRVWSIPDVGEPFDTVAFLERYEDVKGNAFDDYTRANEQLIEMSEEADDLEFSEHVLDWEQAHPALKEWLEKNRAVLEFWQRGTEKPFGFEFHPKDCTMGTVIPVTGNAYDFTRLALLEACRLKAEGDLSGAWEKHAAILKMVGHLRQSLLLGFSIGARQYNMQRKAFGYLLADERMTAELLEQIAEEFDLIGDSWEPMSTGIKYEYLGAFTTWDAYFQYRTFPNKVFNESEAFRRVVNLGYQNNLEYCDLARELRPESIYQTIDFSEGNIYTQFEQDCNEIFGASMGNSGGYSYFLRDGRNDLKPMPVPETEIVDSVNRLKMSKKIWMLVSPKLVSFFRIEDRFKLRFLIDRVQVQLHRYHRQHGQFPETLEELVPDYLTDLPMDPYNSGQPLLYGRENQEAVLMTLGKEKSLQEIKMDLMEILNSQQATPEGSLIFRVHPPGTKPSQIPAPTDESKNEVPGS